MKQSFEADALRNLEIAKHAYQNIKRHLSSLFNREQTRELGTKIGNRGVPVQIDKTAIGPGNRLVCLSHLNDDFPGIVWLLGIVEINSGKVRLLILPNRTAETCSAAY